MERLCLRWVYVEWDSAYAECAWSANTNHFPSDIRMEDRNQLAFVPIRLGWSLKNKNNMKLELATIKGYLCRDIFPECGVGVGVMVGPISGENPRIWEIWVSISWLFTNVHIIRYFSAKNLGIWLSICSCTSEHEECTVKYCAIKFCYCHTLTAHKKHKSCLKNFIKTLCSARDWDGKDYLRIIPRVVW
jgi:hypothetical protein